MTAEEADDGALKHFECLEEAPAPKPVAKKPRSRKPKAAKADGDFLN